jgi:hypothetical protein
MIFNRKRRRKIFTFKKVARIFTHKGRRTITIGKTDYYVFKCGDEIVVYERDKVVFNSVIEKIPYSTWLKKMKREQ